MQYTAEELLEAKRAIASTLAKCEKALTKLEPGRSQHTLMVRRIRAFRLSLALIDRELAPGETAETEEEHHDGL